MVKQGTGGIIINMSSLVWAKELSRYGIRSVALAPELIDTPSARNIPENVRRRLISSKILLKRLGEIDEVTHAVRFAIENDYLNGRVLDLDGGLRI